MHELRVLRQRAGGLGRELDRLNAGRDLSGSGYELLEVVQVVAVPTAVEKYYAVKSVSVDGTEAENATATFTTSGDRFYVAVIGDPIPTLGTRLVASPITGRWATGGGGGTPHCTLRVNIFRANSCPAVGAHVKIKVGGTTIAEGDTDIFGLIDFGTAVPGVTYTIEWTYFSLSGSTSGTCGSHTLNIANPPDSGLFINCRDAPPSILYVTDEAGTRQVWPTPECVEYDRPVRGFRWYSTSLTPLGSCLSPSWELATDVFTWGTSAGVPIAPCDPAFRQIFDGHNTFPMPCTRPYYYSGNYPPPPLFGAPSHPFPNGPFVFHE